MAKFLYKHRRGSVSDWANKGDEIIPLEGEIVIELDEENNLHKLKIGDGIHAYSELKYLQAGDEIVTQVLAKAKPRVVTIELPLHWTQNSDETYSQVLTLNGITKNSRLDLQPTADMLAEFKRLGLVFVTENNGGIITVYSVGNMPLQAYTMQATIIETECDGQDVSVVGIPIGSPVAQSDWNQADATKSDYIKNKPTLGNLAAKDEVLKTDLAADVQESLNKADAALPVSTTLAELPSDATHRTVTDEEKASWNEKLDKTGGNISGNLVVAGDLTVKGTTKSEDHETILVEDNMVVLNSNKADLQTALSGVAMNKNSSSTYGAVYDPSDDTFKFGEGTLNEEKEFTFNEGEGLPFAVRDDSTQFVDGHIVRWSDDGNKLVDSGKTIDDFSSKEHDHEIEDVAGLQDTLDDKAKIGETIVDDSVAYVKDVSSTSAPYAMISEIGGMTRKCENLIPYPYSETSKTTNGITFTINADGSIIVNGTATADARIFLKAYSYTDNIKLVKGETYTLSGYPVTGIGLGMIQIQDISYSEDYVNEGYAKTFTAQHESYYMVVKILEGKTVSNLVVYPTLNKGDTTLPYEPYFEGLRDAKVTAVESVGVNLFSGIDGVDFSKEIQISALSGQAIKYDFKANTRYKFSWISTCKASSATDHLLYLIVKYTDGTEDNWNNLLARVSDNKAFRAITTTAGKTISKINFMYSSEAVCLFEDISFIEYTGVDIPYTPYFKNTFEIPEAVQALEGYGQGVNKECCNKIVLDPAEGVKKFVKNVSKDTFDGDESGISYVSSTGLFRIELSNDAVKDTSGICNLYGMYVGNYTLCPDQHIMIAPISITNDRHVIFVKDSRFSTVADFKAYLSSNPMQIDYRLATPTETDLSDYFGDDNLIGVEGGGTVTMINEYKYDVPTTIEFHTDNNEEISSNKFIGDLYGTASRSKHAEHAENADKSTCDSMGNVIADTYAKLGDSFVSDNDTYMIDVPENVAKYAEITEIGGMTRKCTNLLKTAISHQWLCTAEVASDGYLTLTSTTAGQSIFAIPFFAKLKANHTYYISLQGASSNIARVVIYNTPTGSSAIDAFSREGAYTPTQDITVYLGVYLIDYTAVGNKGGCYVMLNKGDTALPYEPYFEGLQDAKVMAVESVGANLIPFPYTDSSKKINGVSFTVNADRSITISGTATDTAVFTLSNNIYLGDEDMSTLWVSSATNGKYYLNVKHVYYYAKSLNLSIRITTGAIVNETIYPMASIDRILDYVPYVKNTFPIPEAVQALEGYGQGVNKEYCNKIVLDTANGVKKYVKNVGVVDMGTLDWVLNNANVFQSSTLGKIGNYLICSKYEYAGIVSGNADAYSKGDKTISMYGIDKRIYVRDDSFTDAATFKASMQGVMFVYVLATPTETDISAYINDNSIGIEADGIITMVNEYMYDVPTTITYHTNPNDNIIAADIVGNLIGNAATASKATSVVLTSPNGTMYQLKVSDDGTLSAIKIT